MYIFIKIFFLHFFVVRFLLMRVDLWLDEKVGASGVIDRTGVNILRCLLFWNPVCLRTVCLPGLVCVNARDTCVGI